MGPFTLMDYIGNDVNYAVTCSVFEAFIMTQGLNRVLHKKDIQKQGIWAEKVAKDILIMKKKS